MTKQEAYDLIDAYEASPDGFCTCDNLCTVLDGLPDQPEEGQYTPDEIRTMVEEQLEDDDSVLEDIEDAGPAGTRQADKLRAEYDEAHPIPEWER